MQYIRGGGVMGKYILPSVMICLNLGQAIVCLMRRDFLSVLYWAAAAMLNLSVALKQ